MFREYCNNCEDPKDCFERGRCLISAITNMIDIDQCSDDFSDLTDQAVKEHEETLEKIDRKKDSL